MTPSLLILHPYDLSGENHGLLVQHVTTLAELLESRGWSVRATHPLDPRLAEDALAADLVLVQMIAAGEVEGIVRLRRAAGRPTVYEITDNFLAITSWSHQGHPLRSPLVRQELAHLAHACDALQLYAPGLAQLFGGLNERVIRCDPHVPVPARVPEKPEGFVLGWGGTRSHADDVAAMAPAVVAFCRRHPDVTFAFMGHRDLFERAFGAISGAQVSYQPFADHARYLRFVAGLHVGLAPLGPSAFNAARTDTKFATYAAHGVAGVLQDGAVYGPHRQRARIFGSTEELEAVLEDLYADRGHGAWLTERARAWVSAERSFDALAEQRDAAYRELLGDVGPSSPPWPAPGPSGSAASLAARLRAADGLEPGEALVAAKGLVSEHPGYDQAHRLLLRSLEGLGRHEEALEHIARLRPSPVFADGFAEVAVRCARRARPEAVERLVAGVASSYRRARMRTGGEDALSRARATLTERPYDHFALMSAIRLLERRDPESPELGELFGRALFVSPEDVPPERRPAALEAFLPTASRR